MSELKACRILEQRNDQALLDAIRGGDEPAFDTIFRAYYPALCNYARNLTDGDMDDAEDVVQQTFVKLWEQRAQLSVQWSVKAYLYKSVHNRCLNRLRDARTRDRYKEYNAFALEQTTRDNIPGAAQELDQRLRAALETLPPQCRQVFDLSRFEELKYREIADQLQISVKTVESHMGKALRLMREQLSDWLAVGIGFIYWIMG